MENKTRMSGFADHKLGSLSSMGKVEKLLMLSVEELVPFEDADGKKQGYDLLPEDKLIKMATSMQLGGGILEPVLVIHQNLKYMIVSGHNRVEAEKLRAKRYSNGVTNKIPCRLIKVEDINEAKGMLITSNKERRQGTKPSERAYEYDDMRTRLGKSVKEIAEEENTTVMTVHNYLALRKLSTECIALVNEGVIKVVEGASLASFPQEYQLQIFNFSKTNKLKINSEFVKKINKHLEENNELTDEGLLELFSAELFGLQNKKEKEESKKSLHQTYENIKTKYFAEYSDAEYGNKLEKIFEKLAKTGELQKLLQAE